MDIRIGVTYTTKELTVELPEGSEADAVKAHVAGALGGDTAVLWLEDRKGRQVGIPADKVAYVEIGSESASRPIGFG